MWRRVQRIFNSWRIGHMLRPSFRLSRTTTCPIAEMRRRRIGAGLVGGSQLGSWGRAGAAER